MQRGVVRELRTRAQGPKRRSNPLLSLPCLFQLYRPSFVHPGAATVPTMSAAFPGASLYLPMAQSVAVGPLGSAIPMAYYPVGPIYPPGSAVLVEGGYDAGARFGAGAAAGNIPVSISVLRKP